MKIGKIHCRFENGSSEIRELGRYLKNSQTPTFQPYFTIRDNNHHESENTNVSGRSELSIGRVKC